MILLSITDKGATSVVPKRPVTTTTTTGYSSSTHNPITAHQIRQALELAKNSNMTVGTKVRVLSTGKEYKIVGTIEDEAFKSRGSYRIHGSITTISGKAEGYNITCLVIGDGVGAPMASLYAPGELEVLS